jgi:hypothetical protein
VKATLEAINQMQTDGVIGKYAIGGAVGALLYLEPASTLDIDIFVALPAQAGSQLLSLAPLYDYLRARGAAVEDEHIKVGDWPVQFLPPGSPLEEEAIAESIATTVEGVSTWVISAEHLVAIALQTGRTKDHFRIQQFVEQGKVDLRKLQAILERHNLMAKWLQFKHKYLEGTDG